jgi:hypothetical protein
LRSVDFPTLGLPMMPMKPDLNTDVSFLYGMMTGKRVFVRIFCGS